jgi:hypothetical protein
MFGARAKQVKTTTGGSGCQQFRVTKTGRFFCAARLVTPRLVIRTLLDRGPAAIDRQGVPGDHRGRWAGEKDDRRSDIFRFSDTAQRDTAN